MYSEIGDYLRPTAVFDFEDAPVQAKASEVVAGAADAVEKSKRLFYFVRDEIRYRFYPPETPPRVLFRASHTLSNREGFCVPKAILLAAMARAVGIPAGIGFADIRNHLLPDKARELMGDNLIRLHGYAVLHLDGQWVKATPAFDRNMCQDNGLRTVEFDGLNDAMLPTHDVQGRWHIEYVEGVPHRLYVTDLRRYYDDIDPDRLAEAMLEGFEGDSLAWPGS